MTCELSVAVILELTLILDYCLNVLAYRPWRERFPNVLVIHILYENNKKKIKKLAGC
jgi:hypothetical protein